MSYAKPFLFTKTVGNTVNKSFGKLLPIRSMANSSGCLFFNHCVSEKYSHKIYGDGIPQGPLRMYNDGKTTEPIGLKRPDDIFSLRDQRDTS